MIVMGMDIDDIDIEDIDKGEIDVDVYDMVVDIDAICVSLSLCSYSHFTVENVCGSEELRDLFTFLVSSQA